MKFKSNIEVQAGVEDSSGSAGTAGQILSSLGPIAGLDGVGWIDQSALVSGSAERVSILVKNGEGTALVKGDPVYIIGSVGASARLEVGLCDASDSSKMPCVGLLEQNLLNNGEGTAVTAGKLRNLVTTPIDGQTTTENDTIYVKAGGSSGSSLTTTKPTGSTNLIQNVGQVGRVSTSSDGNFVVSAIMRTNDVPNLPEGRIWIGDGNTIVSDTVYVDEPNNRVGIGTDSPSAKLEVKNSTVSSYSLRFTASDDGDMGGWYQDASNNSELFLKDGSSNTKVFINSAGNSYFNGGNVGIGTTNPSTRLHVYESTSLDHITIDGNAGDNRNLRFATEDSTRWNLYTTGTAESGANVGSDFTIARYGDNGSYIGNTFTIKRSTGNVGIGTTSPSANLEVAGGSVVLGQNKIDGSSDNLKISADFGGVSGSSTIEFLVDSSEKMRITNGGNVGIGTTSPGRTLDVSGGLRINEGNNFTDFDIKSDRSSGNIGGISFVNASDSIRGQIYGHTDGSVKISSGGTSVSMTVLSGGNVGIGTTSPSAKLDVVSTTAFVAEFERSGSANYDLAISDIGDGAAQLWFNANTNDTGFVFRPKNSSGTVTNAMFINPSGNVGIGTTSPSEKLSISGAKNTPIIHLGSTNNDSSWSIGDKIGAIEFGSADGSGAGAGVKASISYEVEAGTTGSTNSMVFRSAGTSAGTNNTERMRITSDGDVGIGTDNPGAKLHVAAGTGSPTVLLGRATGQASIKADTDSSGHLIIDSSTGHVYINNYVNKNIYLANGGGNVGIGTTSPGSKLTIENASGGPASSTYATTVSNANLQLSAVGVPFYNHLFMGVGSATYAWIQPQHGNSVAQNLALNPIGGNVGIGMTSPSTKLEVAGDVTISGDTKDLIFSNTAETKAGIVFIDAQAGAGQAAAIKFDCSAETLDFFVNDESAERMSINTSGVLTINGGNIILSGTGRIQGVGTVSVGTDAANKAYVDTAVAGVPQGDITAVVAGTGLTGGGTSGSVTLNVAGGTYTPYNDIRSLGVRSFTNGANPNITTAQVMDEIDTDGGFDSYSSVFKTSWSYAGNYNLTDAGDFTETAGSSWITWTDNSSDSTRGNITTLAIAPNTGGSAGGVFIYNNQGSSYNPGWRQVWTSMTDGAGSGLDADLLDGQQGSYYATAASLGNYLPVNNPTFTGTLTGPAATITGNIDIQDNDIVIDSSHGFINSGAWTRNTTPYGNIEFGPANTTWAHIYTDRPNFYFNKELYVNNNIVWNAGNDGAGSGLNADTVDGYQATSLLKSDENDAFTGTLTMGTQKALVANNYGRGVYGLYSATRYQHVWSMGVAYNLADNGSSSGNLYGLSFTHTNVGGQSKPGLSHQLLVMDNGVTKTALGSGIWTSGNATIEGDVYITDQIIHTGDTDTYLQFHAANQFRIVTGGTEMLEVNDSYVQLGAGLNANNQVIINVEDIALNDRIYHDDDTNTYMQFHAADQWRVVTGGTERLEVNNSATMVSSGNFLVNAGNVGIGTTSPTSALGSTKVLDISSTGNAEIILDHTDAGTASDLGLYSWARNNDHLAHIKATCDGSTTAAFISFHAQPSGGSFSNAASNEKMRIKSNGNVGIGTTNPQAKLHVSGGSSVETTLIVGAEGTGNDKSARVFLNEGEGGATNSKDYGFSLAYDGQGAQYSGLAANQFGILRHDNSAGGTAVMVMNRANNNTTFKGGVTATVFINSSDERLKENIKELSGNVEVNWKTFELKAEKGQKRYGVIAQELEKTNPEFVKEDSKGFKSVNYIDLLIAKIAELEQRIQLIENK